MTTAPNRGRRVSPQTDRTPAVSKRQATVKPPRVLERDFQRQVIQLARTCGWLVEHKYGQGSVLGSKAIDKGFPDLVLARDGEVFFVELKGSGGKLSPEQRQWLDHITRAGIPAFVFWPHEFAAVEALLTSAKPNKATGMPMGGAA